MNVNIALAYVGAVVPDEPAFHNRAFNRAGNMFQENLLAGLRAVGVAPALVLSQRPWPAFPRTRNLWLRAGRGLLRDGTEVRFVPFLNLPIIRPLFVGLVVLLNLVAWGWQNRDVPHKIVFTYNLTEPSGVFTLLAARLIGAKVVVSLNDIHVPGHLVANTLARRVDFWLQKKIIPRFDGRVVVSHRIVEDFAPGLSNVLIEGGVRDEVLAALGQPIEPQGDTDVFTIVSAGTLYEANGFVELLEAFTRLKGDRYRLVIAGKGPMEDEIRQAAQKDPRIEFKGFLSFEEVLELYQTAHVLLNNRVTKRLNTEYFFPSKLLECLASGIPVISTCTGHVVDVFGDYVYLLQDETGEGLARMIEYVASLDPTLRAEKGRTARGYVLTHCTWPAQASRVAAFLRQLFVG